MNGIAENTFVLQSLTCIKCQVPGLVPGRGRGVSGDREPARLVNGHGQCHPVLSTN